MWFLNNSTKYVVKKPDFCWASVATLLILLPKVLADILAKGINTIEIRANFQFCKNITNNKPIKVNESLKRVEEIISEVKKHNIKVRGYLSCVLGCPYEGKVSYESTADLAAFLIEQGCYQVSLGDTIGWGTPFDAIKLFELVSKNVNIENIAAHFHDTYGQALSNIYAVLQMGVQTLDTSIAGLGGCPYAKGATGNVATEDVLYMLNGMGIKTGIKLEEIINKFC